MYRKNINKIYIIIYYNILGINYYWILNKFSILHENIFLLIKKKNGVFIFYYILLLNFKVFQNVIVIIIKVLVF